MQFSDTIACVLFRITCLELFFVFFQHVQGSTSFSIVQFSRSCAGRLADSSFIISHSVSFVKHFFEIFLSHLAFPPARCLGDSLFILLHPRSFVKTFFEVFSVGPGSPFCRPPAASSLLLSGASLRSSGIWLCNRCCRSRQLDYNTASQAECQYLFDKFFLYFLCIPYMVHSLVSGHKI